MRGKMFLTFVAAACVFFSMGLGNPTSPQVPVCKDRDTVVKAGRGYIIIPHYTANCTCEVNGERGQHPDGTKCHDGNGRIGNCTQGKCTTAPSSYGCEGKNGSEKGSTVDKTMCTFTCTNKDGKTEWAYSPDGTSCLNLDEDDGSLENAKNGTCKHRPHRDRVNETVCFPNDQMHLLGC
uniref:Putative secreted protein n=1 Tax=Amblyomma cajennense TaxID=34607 RepID=A0A023FQH3_AMBCJ